MDLSFLLFSVMPMPRTLLLGQPLANTPHDSFAPSGRTQVVLPHPYDRPVLSLKLFCHSAIPDTVSFDLVLPELITVGLYIMAPGTPMPETAIDKDDDPFSREDQVRLSQEPFTVHRSIPIWRDVAEPQPPEERSKHTLRASATSVTAHGFHSLLRSHHVSAHSSFSLACLHLYVGV